MSPLEEIKRDIADLISKQTELTVESTDFVIPEHGQGDIALPCFKLAKQTQTPPDSVAQTIASVLATHSVEAEAAGPYVNIRITRSGAAQNILTAKKRSKKGEKILLEYVSPNTNKPLHLGHLRNAALGWSLAKILEAEGHEVVKAQIVNDRGIHIMKPLLTYQRWGNNETPENTGIKGDHLVAKFYVQFGEEVKKNPKLDEEAQSLLVKWEAGETEIRKIWQQLREWVLRGHQETYGRIGIEFDRTDFESEIYEDGKKIVLEALKKKLVRQRDDGAIVVDLASGEEKVLLRSDGTTVYITQDLALAERRLHESKAKKLLYVIGQEQDYQFQVLFEVLEKLGIATKEQLVHISYHHVLLPEGRMKSREGTVVDTDNLLDELHHLAAEEVKKRTPDIETNELQQRAETIALAAVKFFLLKVRPNSDVTFNPKESLAFVGHTGPYLLYTYARIQSIFKKVPGTLSKPTKKVPGTITDPEWAILMILARLPDVVSHAAKANDPSLVADIAYDLAKTINDFYEKEPVLKADDETRKWRLALLRQASTALQQTLNLLGIQTLDEM